MTADTPWKKWSAVGVLFAFFVAAACSRNPEKDLPADRAEFGVFFGGQVQERTELRFELDPAKQTQGFRIDFGRPVARDTPVEWQISRPRSKPRGRARSDAGKDHVIVGGKDLVRAGQQRFEHVVRFNPGDPLGLWNIRVVVGNRVLLDRPFTVYDAAVRARQMIDSGIGP